MKIKNFFFRTNILVFVAILAFLGSCQWVTIDLPPAEATDIPEGDTISFSADIQPIFSRCTGCHDAETAGNDYLDLTAGKSYVSINKHDRINLTTPETSRFYTWPSSGDHTGPAYSTSEAAKILTWIQQGALNN